LVDGTVEITFYGSRSPREGGELVGETGETPCHRPKLNPAQGFKFPVGTIKPTFHIHQSRGWIDRPGSLGVQIQK